MLPFLQKGSGEYGALRIESFIVPGENVTALDIDYGCALQSHRQTVHRRSLCKK